MQPGTAKPEPTFAEACAWWADLPAIWTPVGWKDHLFRFNVLWNGDLYAEPHLNRRTTAWKHDGLHLMIWPDVQEWGLKVPIRPWTHDDGMVRQGWHEDDAPVLWSEWSRDGVRFRSSVLAHTPGGGDVKTGSDPLFAWLRLSVEELCPGLPLEDACGFNLHFLAPRLKVGMSLRQNVQLVPGDVHYPRRLHAEPAASRRGAGPRILERNGQVRLAVAAGADILRTSFKPGLRAQPVPSLWIQLPSRKGAHVDVLLPMIPADRAIADRELALGFDGARAETRRYWRRVLATRARFDVPEADITDSVRQSVRLSHMLAEKNPATGRFCKVTGSLAYTNLWTTPNAMEMAMMLDILGHHRTVEQYLDIFREEQGTVTPPGQTYKPHPGYLSTPALYKSIDWLSDNGAVLYTLCMHGLLSGDRSFQDRYLPVILKSCDWIAESRRLRGHGGVEGVLPAAVATDRMTQIQALWSDGWNYKGLCAAVRLLRRLRHPRAEALAREAREYRHAFQAALRRKCRTMPTWRAADGRRRILVPTALTGEARNETRHAFYLDTGPLFLVFAGLMDAGDPLMQDVRRWFREGPQRRFYRRDSNCWQVPVLDHEMSSCEPCYSWNVFHAWQAGDRPRFLEGMYSLFAGSLSRQTRVSCETRGGITGTVFAASLALYLARLAVLDDELRDRELHLLRLMPLAWLRANPPARFENMPTVFGPVSLVTRLARGGRTLLVRFQPRFREAPDNVLLHVPPLPGLKEVSVNGRVLSARAGRVLTVPA